MTLYVATAWAGHRRPQRRLATALTNEWKTNLPRLHHTMFFVVPVEMFGTMVLILIGLGSVGLDSIVQCSQNEAFARVTMLSIAFHPIALQMPHARTTLPHPGWAMRTLRCTSYNAESVACWSFLFFPIFLFPRRDGTARLRGHRSSVVQTVLGGGHNGSCKHSHSTGSA